MASKVQFMTPTPIKKSDSHYKPRSSSLMKNKKNIYQTPQPKKTKENPREQIYSTEKQTPNQNSKLKERPKTSAQQYNVNDEQESIRDEYMISRGRDNSQNSQYAKTIIKSLNQSPDKSQINIDEVPDSVRSEFNKEFCQYITGQCTCGKCKWPYATKKPNFPYDTTTIYQRDYPWRDPEIRTKPLQNILEQTQLNKEAPGYFSTTNRTEYQIPHEFQRAQSFKPENQLKVKQNVPFEASTSYKKDYLEWSAGHKPIAIKPPQIVAGSAGVPLECKTTYGEAFSKSRDPSAGKQQSAKPNQNQSSLFTNAPFIGKTTYGDTYQPLKFTPERGQDTLKILENSQYGSMPSYPGQFNTEKASAYDWKQPKKCPAREMIQQLSKHSQKAKEVLVSLK